MKDSSKSQHKTFSFLPLKLLSLLVPWHCWTSKSIKQKHQMYENIKNKCPCRADWLETKLIWVIQQQRGMYSWFAPDVAAAILVYSTIVKKSLLGIWPYYYTKLERYSFSFVHLHVHLITWEQPKNRDNLCLRSRVWAETEFANSNSLLCLGK